MQNQTLTICVSALAFLMQVACGDEGNQATCPPVTRYDVREEDVLDRSSPQYRQLRKAAAAGCITYPVPPSVGEGGAAP